MRHLLRICSAHADAAKKNSHITSYLSLLRQRVCVQMDGWKRYAMLSIQGVYVVSQCISNASLSCLGISSTRLAASSTVAPSLTNQLVLLGRAFRFHCCSTFPSTTFNLPSVSLRSLLGSRSSYRNSLISSFISLISFFISLISFFMSLISAFRSSSFGPRIMVFAVTEIIVRAAGYMRGSSTEK